jgi:hypothetical protein
VLPPSSQTWGIRSQIVTAACRTAPDSVSPRVKLTAKGAVDSVTETMSCGRIPGCGPRDREQPCAFPYQFTHTVSLYMSTTIKESKSIPENPPRWKPSSDPASIIVPGLDTTASVTDQIDQIDQLITLKLQVSYACQHPCFCLDLKAPLTAAEYRCQLFQDATGSFEPDSARFQTILDRY